MLGSGPGDFSYTMTLVLTHRNQDSYSFRISVGKFTSLHEIFATLMCKYFAKLLHFESLSFCVFEQHKRQRQEKRDIGTKKGFEIPVEATAGMVTTSKNLDVVERFKQLMELHYREPINGRFEDCTKEVQPGKEIESSSDEPSMPQNSKKCDFMY